MQIARNPAIRIRRPFFLISPSFWYPNETVVIGTIVINCNCITFGTVNCLSAVCPVVFGLKQKDASSLFAFTSPPVYAIREGPAKQEGLEFSASQCDVGVGLIYSHHRISL